MKKNVLSILAAGCVALVMTGSAWASASLGLSNTASDWDSGWTYLVDAGTWNVSGNDVSFGFMENMAYGSYPADSGITTLGVGDLEFRWSGDYYTPGYWMAVDVTPSSGLDAWLILWDLDTTSPLYATRLHRGLNSVGLGAGANTTWVDAWSGGIVEDASAALMNVYNWQIGFTPHDYSNFNDGYYIFGESATVSRFEITDGPVPEPETVWMIVAVLASLGVTFRRQLMDFAGRFVKT